jgi:hypothetical protein
MSDPVTEYQPTLEQIQSQLAQALATRDDALGRAGLAERRAVQAEASEKAAQEALALVQQAASDQGLWCATEKIRLECQRRQLATHIRELLQRDRSWNADFELISRAITLPVIFWPFIGSATWLRRTWRTTIAHISLARRKARP